MERVGSPDLPTPAWETPPTHFSRQASPGKASGCRQSPCKGNRGHREKLCLFIYQPRRGKNKQGKAGSRQLFTGRGLWMGPYNLCTSFSRRMTKQFNNRNNNNNNNSKKKANKMPPKPPNTCRAAKGCRECHPAGPCSWRRSGVLIPGRAALFHPFHCFQM